MSHLIFLEIWRCKVGAFLMGHPVWVHILKKNNELFQHWWDFLGSSQKWVGNFTLIVLDYILEFQNFVTFMHFVYLSVCFCIVRVICKADHRWYYRAKTHMIGQNLFARSHRAEFSLNLVPWHCSLIKAHFDRRK